ncbi:uncharacterized protein LOC126891303 [Diabrotica virgifera virgifera]|uniref:DNA-directed DNA polymerase n=1 Tax=Diabrotica virgifera virgifera TaxID=50390 RepID=A0ABM5L1X2_DIAVI|nr:uncharacterized protein LOC126891033 [Diabrotica virgifera virgifera]XP_050516439.1 uncharacterized protein LOC126891303 [Diabrotica virgifera virgifera]
MIIPNWNKRILKFSNFKNKIKVSFVIYADIECLLLKYSDPTIPTANMRKIQHHVPYSVAFLLKCSYDDSLTQFKIYTGEDCISWFVKELGLISKKLDDIYSNVVPMTPLTNLEENQFLNAELCYICTQPFSDDDIKCKDHCHRTGTYRGPSHQCCNLQLRETFMIPIVFHNLGYDSHFLIKHLNTDIEGNFQILPLNKERYISFTKFVQGTKCSLRFIDSYRFMSESIDKLASYLTTSQNKILKSFFPNEIQFNLLTRKGVFPYEYLDSWEKLKDENLPPKNAFYSTLTKTHISDDDYNHACNIWTEFHNNTLKDFSEIYLTTDVLLLGDIVENFRETSLKTYGLDPLHYYTAPGLSFDACLKITGVEIELLDDIDKVMFIERGLRGGISQVSNRYGKANNKYMSKDYNEQDRDSYLIYWDFVNLYGTIMCFSLPYGGFEWIDPNVMPDITTVDKNSDIGYILECDIIYSKELFNIHKDLPLCPEHLIPPKSKSKVTKLLTTLFDKKHYIIHYRALQQAVTLGLKLDKIYRVLKFNQAPWVKKYVDLNTELRKKSKNEFESNNYKMMTNSFFGKTCENVRKYKDCKLLSKWEGRYGVRNYISKPNFHSLSIINENLVVVEMKRTQITFNKPLFIGFSILDLSKVWLYDFHYNYTKNKFGDNAKLLYCDTDSLIYHIFDENVYEHMRADINKFDTSNFSVNNAYNMPLCNKKVLGLMKDENGGRIMTEFVGLRSKMYALKVLNEKEEYSIKKAKGIKKVN